MTAQVVFLTFPMFSIIITVKVCLESLLLATDTMKIVFEDLTILGMTPELLEVEIAKNRYESTLVKNLRCKNSIQSCRVEADHL